MTRTWSPQGAIVVVCRISRISRISQPWGVQLRPLFLTCFDQSYMTGTVCDCIWDVCYCPGVTCTYIHKSHVHKWLIYIYYMTYRYTGTRKNCQWCWHMLTSLTIARYYRILLEVVYEVNHPFQSHWDPLGFQHIPTLQRRYPAIAAIGHFEARAGG